MSFSLRSACPRRLPRTLSSSAPHSSPHHRYYHHHHSSLLSPPYTSPRPLSPLSTGSSREFSSSSSVSTAYSWPFLRSPRPPLTNWHQNLLSSSAAKTTASVRLLSSSLVLSSTVPVERPRFLYTMTGGDASSTKRKHADSNAPPAADQHQPAKHLKPETANILTPGDSTPANGTVYDVQNEDDASRLLAIGSTQADSPEWQATIENVVKSVVSIHYCQTCSFDTELSMSSQATGFVVDAQRGYILTNRHVVCSGPFWGYVIFDNHEEVGI